MTVDLIFSQQTRFEIHRGDAEPRAPWEIDRDLAVERALLNRPADRNAHPYAPRGLGIALRGTRRAAGRVCGVIVRLGRLGASRFTVARYWFARDLLKWQIRARRDALIRQIVDVECALVSILPPYAEVDAPSTVPAGAGPPLPVDGALS